MFIQNKFLLCQFFSVKEIKRKTQGETEKFIRDKYHTVVGIHVARKMYMV